MTTEIQAEDLPCYQCLCLAACKAKHIDTLLKCVNFRGFIFAESGYSFRYDCLSRYMRYGFI